MYGRKQRFVLGVVEKVIGKVRRSLIWRKIFRQFLKSFKCSKLNTGNDEKLKREEKQYDEIMEKIIMYGIVRGYAFLDRGCNAGGTSVTVDRRNGDGVFYKSGFS